jgi:tRNA(Leu) C34 or U34 (ribose-2'-O)-methylase TrmL
MVQHKKQKPGGKPPAVILENPKFAHNVGAVLRACSCYGMKQLIFTGTRVPMPAEGRTKKDTRLPREERMKGYKDVDLVNTDYPFDRFEKIPVVGVELSPGAQPLTWYDHPDDCLYVFGPEDGSLCKSFRRYCHTMLYIPSRHCLNLAAAVYTVLYDRQHKLLMRGQELPVNAGVWEDRGFTNDFGER